MAKHVFISHAWNDSDKAEAIGNHLEKAGIRCWMLRRDVKPGMASITAIQLEIRPSIAVVLVLTQDAYGSILINEAIRRAGERKLPIIPVIIDELYEPSNYCWPIKINVPPFQHIYLTEDYWETGLRILAGRIKSCGNTFTPNRTQQENPFVSRAPNSGIDRALEKSYDIFISYRRADGSELAQVLHQALQERGYKVFLDVRDLPTGDFDESLGIVIKSAPDFIPILTHSALFPREVEKDWFLEEISLALSSNRNICPIKPGAVDWAKYKGLPAPLERLRQHQTITYSHEYCDEVVDRLCQMLSKRPRKKMLGVRFMLGVGDWSKTITIGISFLSILLLVNWIFWMQSERASHPYPLRADQRASEQAERNRQLIDQYQQQYNKVLRTEDQLMNARTAFAKSLSTLHLLAAADPKNRDWQEAILTGEKRTQEAVGCLDRLRITRQSLESMMTLDNQTLAQTSAAEKRREVLAKNQQQIEMVQSFGDDLALQVQLLNDMLGNHGTLDSYGRTNSYWVALAEYRKFIDAQATGNNLNTNKFELMVKTDTALDAWQKLVEDPQLEQLRNQTSDPSPPATQAGQLMTGPTFTITGPVGCSYLIQASTNLNNTNAWLNNTNAWLTLTNITLTTGQAYIYNDSSAVAPQPGGPKKFYRAVPQ